MPGAPDNPAPGSVAIMQPYFFPYGGYFGLFAAAETFIIYDDVQFARRGRVHRCEVPGPSGRTEWLTLPLARQSRNIRIMDLAFAEDARARFDQRLSKLPWLAAGRGPLAHRLREHLYRPLGSIAAFLEAGLALVSDGLGLPVRFVRSSSFKLDSSLRGQDRIIALAEAACASSYVNLSGGRELYDQAAFRRRGIELRFLTAYTGSIPHLLPALAHRDPGDLRNDILRSAQLAE